jgi:heat shock protein HslJ
MYRLLAILIILTVAGCSPKLAPDSNWGYQKWVLIEMKEVPVQQSGGRADAYLEFFPNDKKFSGYGGCNRINGNYTLSKNSSIHFTDVISTKMSCPDLAFENTVLGTLNEVNRYEITENSMLLKHDNKVLLIYQRR